MITSEGNFKFCCGLAAVNWAYFPCSTPELAAGDLKSAEGNRKNPSNRLHSLLGNLRVTGEFCLFAVVLFCFPL